MQPAKLILVIGATGAQGTAVINALLAPTKDGEPSPYVVRALTRNPSSERSKILIEKGVECVQGSFEDFKSVASALQGCYGAWVNTDGFTVGEQREIFAGIKIFEVAKSTPSLRHYVWSNLDYTLKKAGYNLDYKVEHHNGKGAVGDFLKAQPSVVSDDSLSWTSVSSGTYMEMLNHPIVGPLNKREDGTVVFPAPICDGHMAMVALSDLGWWARYTFDHRDETSGKHLKIASDMVNWDYLVSTFTKVTKQPAIFKRQELDDWWLNFDGADAPIASDLWGVAGATTVRQNFSAWWRQWRDNIIQRDMEWIRKVHPDGHTLESWMRATNYTGDIGLGVLKNVEEGKAGLRANLGKCSTL